MNTVTAGSQYWNRDELYEDVWRQPLTALIPKYGVSAVAIGKACRKLQVPLPGRGYWAKKAHGHSVKHKSLPRLHEVPRVWRYQRPAASIPNPAPPPKPQFPVEADDISDIARIDNMLSAGVFVSSKPRRALRHPLVVAARGLLRQGHADMRQILCAPYNESCLDIRVSKPVLSRALEVMSAIIAILESQGITIKVIRDERSPETISIIFGERIQFGILEHTRQVRVPDSTVTPSAAGRQRYSTHYEPTGQLSIRVLSHSSYFDTLWQDTERAKLESLIPEAVATMMKIGVEHRRDTEKRRQEELFRKMRWEELGKLKRQVDAEEARIQRLQAGAENWNRAKLIRESLLSGENCTMLA